MQNAINTLAKAKFMHNKKSNTFRIIAAFNVTQKDKKENWIFPPQSKCNYVSSDLNYPINEEQLQKTKQQMQFLLRTNNIMFV